MSAASVLRPAVRRVARPGSADDRRLVAGVRGGDARCFEAIYDRYHRPLLSFCRHMLGSREEAEDALQHVFVSAHGRLRADDRDIDLRPWLYAIARNRCLSMLRARRHTVALEDVPEASGEGLLVAAEVEQRQDLRDVLADMARLPEDQRAALVLSELGDMSHEQIAEALDVRRDKVKALVFQGREALMGYRAARAADCAPIREQLATLRGSALRRTELRRHLAVCSECAEFKDEVARQRTLLGAVLPVVPAVGLRDHILGAVQAAADPVVATGVAATGAGAAATLGGGAGGTAATGGSVAAVAAGTATGAVAAGSSGLVAKALVVAAIAASAGGGAVVVEHERSRPAPTPAPAAGTPAAAPAPRPVAVTGAGRTLPGVVPQPLRPGAAAGSTAASASPGRGGSQAAPGTPAPRGAGASQGRAQSGKSKAKRLRPASAASGKLKLNGPRPKSTSPSSAAAKAKAKAKATPAAKSASSKATSKATSAQKQNSRGVQSAGGSAKQTKTTKAPASTSSRKPAKAASAAAAQPAQAAAPAPAAVQPDRSGKSPK
ncbi:RNA polymerase sigma factor [Paraconexibacter sp. AEG42_29]|uniref:RNA polymerase sigma factor n=1 Tax=Paraconexibacter sp. AEG42_29 TaxID=2997339 RepID=A0AAU7ARI2_9ACTN